VVLGELLCVSGSSGCGIWWNRRDLIRDGRRETECASKCVW
jgi:hypothetical protein